MEIKKKKKYFKPEFTVYRIDTRQRLLVGSANASLTGAGIDESDADDNGGNTW